MKTKVIVTDLDNEWMLVDANDIVIETDFKTESEARLYAWDNGYEVVEKFNGENPENKVWMRLGVLVSLPKSLKDYTTADELIDAVEEAVKSGKFKANGNSYIPYNTLEIDGERLPIEHPLRDADECEMEF